METMPEVGWHWYHMIATSGVNSIANNQVMGFQSLQG